MSLLKKDSLVEAFLDVDKALDVLRDEVKTLRAENLMLKSRVREGEPFTERAPDLSAIYLYDSRGTYSLDMAIPTEKDAASSKKVTIVVTEIHSHLDKESADALVKVLKAAGIKVEYGERP